MSAKGRYKLMRDVKKEEKDLQKKARKKGLWGSIGRTIGSLAVMGLTGGAVNPITLGLLTAGGSFLGGAVGAKASGTGDLSKQGRFFKDDREELQDTLGAFGSENITSSLKSGVTAGLGQAAKLQKAKMFGKGTSEAAKLSDGFGMDYEGSIVGKGYGKLKGAVETGLQERDAAKKLSEMRGWQGEYETLKKADIMKDLPEGYSGKVFNPETGLQIGDVPIEKRDNIYQWGDTSFAADVATPIGSADTTVGAGIGLSTVIV